MHRVCPRFGFLRHRVICVIQAVDLRLSVTVALRVRHRRVTCVTWGEVTQVTHDDADFRALRHPFLCWSGSGFPSRMTQVTQSLPT